MRRKNTHFKILIVTVILKRVVEQMMGQITVYLDDATQALVDQAAEANGISKSHWVADTIHCCDAHEWPQACLNLAGSFPDFPLAVSLPKNEPSAP